MVYETNFYKIENVEKFQNWLKQRLRDDIKITAIIKLDEWIEYFISKHQVNGSNWFELSSYYSKTKNPEIINFDYEIKNLIYDENDELENFIEIYTF